MAVARRDLLDSATPGLSADWKLAIAHNSALQSAAAALAASGYRTIGEGYHYRTIQSLTLTVGSDAESVRKLDIFRKKRNLAGYESPGHVSFYEAQEMYELAQLLYQQVLNWMKRVHPKLLQIREAKDLS